MCMDYGGKACYLLFSLLFSYIPYPACVVLRPCDDGVPLIVEGTTEDLISVPRQHLQWQAVTVTQSA